MQGAYQVNGAEWELHGVLWRPAKSARIVESCWVASVFLQVHFNKQLARCRGSVCHA